MNCTLNSLEDPRLRLLVCGFKRILPNRWNFSKVSYPLWRLYWNSSPGASIRCGGRTIPLKPSAAVLVPPNTLLSTVNQKECGHLYLHFQAPLDGRKSLPRAVEIPMTPPLVEIARSLQGELDGAEPSVWRVSLMGRAMVEMALASADFGQDDGPRLDARIVKVLSYMDDHLAPNTTNTDLAREARMSAGALNRLFKDQTGHSLQAHLRFKRIEKAGLLLQFSELSIEQIAAETGFCDRYHFSRVFRTVQGVSPAAFRLVHFNPFLSQESDAAGR